jgi:hypothetical protein
MQLCSRRQCAGSGYERATEKWPSRNERDRVKGCRGDRGSFFPTPGHRHLLRVYPAATPSSHSVGHNRGYPFMAPAIKPRVRARCSTKKKIRAGSVVRTPAAMMLPHCVVNWLMKV